MGIVGRGGESRFEVLIGREGVGIDGIGTGRGTVRGEVERGG